MFKSRLSKLYLITELLLFIALMVLQILLITQGKYIWDKESNLWDGIAGIKVALTSVSFTVVVITFIINRNKEKSLLDLLIIYFILTVTADVFFSFSTIKWIPHFLFLLTYILFIFIRNGKWYEVFIPLVIGLVAFLILWLGLNRDLIISLIDSLLGATLIFNMVMCFYKFFKTKDSLYLYFSIALVLIIISDLSIALGTAILKPMTVNHVICLFNWPCYICGNILIVSNYIVHKNK